MKPIYAMLAALAFSALAFADVIPEYSHPFSQCVKVSNLNEFPDVYLIGFITGPMVEKYQSYQIKQDECLGKGYKFNSLSVFWTSKSHVGLLGIDGLKTKEITKTNPECTDANGNECTYKEYSFDDPQVYLLSGSIEPYGGYVSNFDNRRGQTTQYYLVKNADSSLSLEKGEITTTYLDNTSTVIGKRPTAQNQTPVPSPSPQPSPNPAPALSKSIFDSFMCFFIQLFGGRC